jgi:hypothetical protein
MAIYPWLLKMTRHLRMLREMMRHVDNADDALLSDPHVTAVYSTC